MNRKLSLFVMLFGCWICIHTLNAQRVTTEMIQTNLVEDGEPIELEMVFYRPDGEGPFPTLIFNHGSTGAGNNPNDFIFTWSSLTLGTYFADRGWLVVFPQRRGRGQSDGLYDEGFTEDRSGYTCEPVRSLAGLERAIEDMDEVVEHLMNRPEVQPRGMLIGGQSRGGILSIVYAGKRPGIFNGVINFVGGWQGEGCESAAEANTVSFARGGSFPHKTIWFYGTQDTFYSNAHSQANHAAFIEAGGQGDFILLDRGGINGHFIIRTPALWTSSMDAYMDQLPELEEVIAPEVVSLGLVNESTAQIGFTTQAGVRYRLMKSKTLGENSWETQSENILGYGENALIEVDETPPVFFTIQVEEQ